MPKSSLEAAQASLQKDLSCQIVYFPNNSRLEQTFWENNYGKETVPKARASGFGILDHSPRLVPVHVPLYVFTPHPRIPPPETRVFGTISIMYSENLVRRPKGAGKFCMFFSVKNPKNQEILKIKPEGVKSLGRPAARPPRSH